MVRYSARSVNRKDDSSSDSEVILESEIEKELVRPIGIVLEKRSEKSFDSAPIIRSRRRQKFRKAHPTLLSKTQSLPSYLDYAVRRRSSK